MPSAVGRDASAAAIRTLLSRAIDYAGLFPPASLSIASAVSAYSEYRRSADSWALGRFILPASRMRELAEARPSADGLDDAWRLAITAGPGGADDWDHVERCAIVGTVVDAFELKVETTQDIEAAARRLPRNVDVFYEVRIDNDPRPLLTAVAGVGGKAKVRTGSVRSDGFPSAADLARFLVVCARAGVAFKATAGLHHPLRGKYQLTYENESEHSDMFGFVNLLLAAALARAGGDTSIVAALLVEADPANVKLGPDGARWRDVHLPLDDLRHARESAVSFGSCSFREPIDELLAIGLL